MMDLDLGDESGVEATREIVARRPNMGVLVVTMVDDDDTVFAAVRAGARGYLLKEATTAQIGQALQAVARGEAVFGARIADRVLTSFTAARTAASSALPFPQLTDREREVLDLVARGHDNLTISRRLVLSPKTVRNVVSNVLTKLAVRDRAAAIVLARDHGLGLD